MFNSFSLVKGKFMTISLPSLEELEARFLLSGSYDIGFDIPDCPGELAAGQTYHLTVDLSDCGEAAASGKATLRFYLVPCDVEYDDVPSKAYQFDSAKVSLNFDENGQQEVVVDVTVPAGKAEDSYTLYVGLDTSFTDAEPSDNSLEFGVDVVAPSLDIGIDGADLSVDNGRVVGTVDLGNYSNYFDLGAVNLCIYAVPIGGGDAQKVLIKKFTPDMSFVEDDSITVDVDVALPAKLADGNYVIAVEATPKSGEDANTDDNSLTLEDTFAVGQEGPVLSLSYLDGSLYGDGTGSVSLSMDRTGDLLQVGQVSFSVYLSASGVLDSQAVLAGSFSDTIDFTDYDSADTQGDFTVPADTADGDYYLIVVANVPASGGAKASQSTIVSDYTVTVGDPQPAGDDPVQDPTQDPTQGPGDGWGDYPPADQAQMDLNLWIGYDGSNSDGTIQAHIGLWTDGWQINTGKTKYQIYASTSGALDNSAVLLTTFTRQDSIDSWQTGFDVNCPMPEGMPDGRYQLVVKATPLDNQGADLSNNVDSTGWWDAFSVGTDAGVSAGDVTLTDGRSGSVAVTLGNSGTQDVGTVRYEVYLEQAPQTHWGGWSCGVHCDCIVAGEYWSGINSISLWDGGAEQVDDNPILLQTVDRSDSVAPGGSASFNLDFTLPDGLADGDYRLVIKATTLDGQDVDASDNVSSAWKTISLTTADNGDGPVQSVAVEEPICYITCCGDTAGISSTIGGVPAGGIGGSVGTGTGTNHSQGSDSNQSQSGGTDQSQDSGEDKSGTPTKAGTARHKAHSLAATLTPALSPLTRSSVGASALDSASPVKVSLIASVAASDSPAVDSSTGPASSAVSPAAAGHEQTVDLLSTPLAKLLPPALDNGELLASVL